ncbi:hypothetical protein [Cellulomonas sp. ATA003]|uniref:hypothetical protein n=1 Tax=Cellulomonas sp. ATA003 TaxID=3073064 RepID=UPI0028730B1B|nr:hypothetical protein [Cellulomonas sp. ATA003]WNB87660.1 hypothetical protein REH70_01270 [Cellulomonas sp. ATA003]
MLDAAADLALPVTVGATRREAAACLAVGVGAASAAPLTGLATRADAVVFAPGHPGDAEVDGYWAGVDDVVAAMRAAVPRSRRLRSRWSTASLRRRRGARAPVPVPPRDRTVEQGARPAVPAPVTGPSPRTVPSRTSTPHAVSARTAPPHPVRTHPRPIRPGRTGRHTVPTAPTPRPRGRSSRDGES